MSQTIVANPSLDAGLVGLDEWPQMAAPQTTGRREGGFQTIIKRAVLDKMHDHGRGDTSVEVCGVLIGNVYRDNVGPYLYITDCIEGDSAAQHAAQVTFTAKTWDHINDVMDRVHTSSRIVGWYHTHPGFDIFLSGMDLFIQDNFFNLPWQVAFVYDPIGEVEGLFVWRKGKSEKEPFLVEEDPLAVAVARQRLPRLDAVGKGPITRGGPARLMLTAFIIAFLAAYIGILQWPTPVNYGPRQASPGLLDDSAHDAPPGDLLDQPLDVSADDPVVDVSTGSTAPSAQVDPNAK